MKTLNTSKSFDEYKAAFALRGTTINRWSLENGVNPQSAYDAFKGARSGPSAQAILRKANTYLKKTA